MLQELLPVVIAQVVKRAGQTAVIRDKPGLRMNCVYDARSVTEAAKQLGVLLYGVIIDQWRQLLRACGVTVSVLVTFSPSLTRKLSDDKTAMLRWVRDMAGAYNSHRVAK